MIRISSLPPALRDCGTELLFSGRSFARRKNHVVESIPRSQDLQTNKVIVNRAASSPVVNNSQVSIRNHLTVAPQPPAVLGLLNLVCELRVNKKAGERLAISFHV